MLVSELASLRESDQKQKHLLLKSSAELQLWSDSDPGQDRVCIVWLVVLLHFYFEQTIVRIA